MNSRLLSLVPEVDKEKFERAFVNSAYVREFLVEALNEKIDAHYKAMHNRSNYESPSWGFSQADSLGYIRALTECISVLSGENKEKRKRGRPTLESKFPEPLN